jgi:hypothetical protein
MKTKEGFSTAWAEAAISMKTKEIPLKSRNVVENTGSYHISGTWQAKLVFILPVMVALLFGSIIWFASWARLPPARVRMAVPGSVSL